MNAREEVLARIAAAHASAPPPDLPYEGIERRYRQSSDASATELTELTERLVDRLLDYKALVRRSAAGDVGATIEAALTERGVGSLVVPDGFPAQWWTGSVTRLSEPLGIDELDAADGVVSTCAVAVAETGTLVLDGGDGMGRRILSLIPDYHLCVVRPDQIVADVPQALARLDATRPLTMISGPSATSDIELNRVEGVHGPRTLEVVLVESPAA